MITGLELVLAILPLIISATENHKKGLRPIKMTLSSKTKNEQQFIFFEELYGELALLNNTLKAVLGELAPQYSQELVDLTQDELDKIEESLGSSAQPFGALLERLMKSLNDLVSEKSLGLARSDVSNLSSQAMFLKLEGFRTAMNEGTARATLSERFRFTRNEQSRLVALSKIRIANKQLEQLVLLSLVAEIYDQHRPVPKRTEKERRLRRMSEPLFRKIRDKLTTACETHNLHEARLCLWNCCSQERQRRQSDSLDMVLSVTDVGDNGSHWQESVILISPLDSQPVSKPVVRFQIEGTTIDAPTTTGLVGRDIESEPLCALIQQAHTRRSTLEIIFEQGRLWQTRSRRNSLSIQKQKDITLKEFLDTPSSPVSLREKRILAVVLAHAALHGSGSPWLNENWSKDHISFFKKDGSSIPDLRRPFLKVLLDENNVANSQAKNMWTVNSSLESLGILLLEINSGDPIESKYVDEELDVDGRPNEFTNLTTALRLLDELKYDVYEGYTAAVHACLHAEMSSSESGESFARNVYERIVLPLERELEHGFKLKPEHFDLVIDQHVPVVPVRS